MRKLIIGLTAAILLFASLGLAGFALAAPNATKDYAVAMVKKAVTAIKNMHDNKAR